MHSAFLQSKRHKTYLVIAGTLIIISRNNNGAVKKDMRLNTEWEIMLSMSTNGDNLIKLQFNHIPKFIPKSFCMNTA